MPDKSTSADDSYLQYFAQFIARETGIIYAEHNAFQLRNRLEEICRLLGEPTIERLHKKAQSGITGSFHKLLVDLATNNETSFFRDPKVFRSIETTAIPEILKVTQGRRPIKIWSAASSTGQEAVSTAILLEELKLKTKIAFDYKITGSDISARVLQRAAEGSYSQLEIQRGLPAALMIKYFKKDENDRWSVVDKIRQTMQFQMLNLKDNLSKLGFFDLIFCRNVLIYQTVESKTEIISRITNQLEPGGFLILGSGESLIGLSSAYDQVLVDGAVLYRKKQTPYSAA